jgi:hypothetical protein
MPLLHDVPESTLLEGPSHAALHHAAALTELQFLQPTRRGRQDRESFQTTILVVLSLLVRHCRGGQDRKLAIKYASNAKFARFSGVEESKKTVKQRLIDLATRPQLGCLDPSRTTMRTTASPCSAGCNTRVRGPVSLHLLA